MPIDQILEIIGAVIGLTYLYCEYKASVSLWYVGIAMSAFYTYIFLHSHLFANAGIYAYNFGANIYGLIVWHKMKRKQMEEKAEDAITHCPKKYTPFLVLIVFFLSIALEILLKRTGNSAQPALDGLTATLGIVAMWLMAHKYIEHWIIWIGVNLASTIMCIQSALYPSAAMFFVYFIVSILGFFNWRKIMKTQQNSLTKK